MKNAAMFSSIIVLFLAYLAFTYIIPYPTKVTTESAQRSILSNSDLNDIDGDNENELSTYSNPELGFRLRYPNDFLISEVSNSPQSKTVVFQKVQFAPETGAFLSVNSTKWEKVITFDELKKIMNDTIREGPGISIRDIDTVSISGVPGYKIVQNYSNSPYGKDATAVFIGAIRDSTIYMLSSLSTDPESFQEMIDSFDFIR
jgi:PsbP-like protein